MIHSRCTRGPPRDCLPHQKGIASAAGTSRWRARRRSAGWRATAQAQEAQDRQSTQQGPAALVRGAATAAQLHVSAHTRSSGHPLGALLFRLWEAAGQRRGRHARTASTDELRSRISEPDGDPAPKFVSDCCCRLRQGAAAPGAIYSMLCPSNAAHALFSFFFRYSVPRSEPTEPFHRRFAAFTAVL